MVFVKRMLNNGSNGNHSSVVPRAPRSIRKRSLREKKFVGPQLCAFELLATVAGKLLEESECSSSTSSSVAVGFDKCGTVNKRVNEQLVDQGCSEGSVYLSENQKGGSREEKLEVVSGDHVSPVVSSTCSEKVESDPKLATVKNRHDDIVEKGTSGELNTVVISEKIVEDAGSPDNFIPEDVNDVKIARNDYDEILFRCSQSKHSRKKARPPTKSADQKFRKLLTSEYWKTGPKLKDCEPTNAGDAVKNNSNNKRPCYEIDESQRKTPLKKRLLFDRSSVVTNDGGVSCESVSNSPEKNIDDNNATITGNEKLCSAFRSQTSNDSGNTHVRLSIKSFKVPELFIEVPENTTVDSLKRTVLEAVTSILDNGLRVGVILHGKKIRDDNRTLLQAGISQTDDMNTVGFMLEPNSPTRPSTPRSPREPKAGLLCDSPKFSPRSQISLQKDVFLLDSQDKPYAADLKIPTQSSRDLVPSVAVELSEKNVADSEALALALLPVNQKPKRSELGQRRTRRPFSVSEVEALVHAVEKLGTGRWRDIKLCSFDNAMHRTYVDLKDKWKTLVHTASISPQQRRGEPVPQELLDRVLAAQAYWSEHPIKTLDKPLQQCLIPKLTDSTTT